MIPSSARQPLGRRVPPPPVGIPPVPSQALRSPDIPVMCGRYRLCWWPRCAFGLTSCSFSRLPDLRTSVSSSFSARCFSDLSDFTRAAVHASISRCLQQ